MIAYEKRALLPELLFRKSGLSLPEVVKDPAFLEDLTQEVFDDLQQSRQALRGQVSALQARNRHVEEYVDMVAHDLKEPLVVMAFTSNLITNILDLSGEKLKEYLRQMGQTADEMKRIINNLKHFSELCSRLSRRWVARWALRANLARAASFTLPCRQSHRPVNG
jgi:signal transduction histidine kinase